MRELEKIILATHLTNLTNEEIWLYEESSGESRLFEPKKNKLPSSPIKTDHLYIVNRKTHDELLRTGRDLSDIAVIDWEHSGHGRPGKNHEHRTFFRLRWGKNMKYYVGIIPPSYWPWRGNTLCS